MMSKLVRSSRLTKSGARSSPTGTIIARWNIHVAAWFGRYVLIVASSSRASASLSSASVTWFPAVER